ncbi:MAG: DUF3347 domain-containing protein [Capnocytophaga sp.]|nr:DUF3347 domain-containing protein [Capnocytophaga sp.]
MNKIFTLLLCISGIFSAFSQTSDVKNEKINAYSRIINAYMEVKTALASAELESVKSKSTHLHEETLKFRIRGLTLDKMGEVQQLRTAIQKETAEMKSATDLSQAQGLFSQISDLLWQIIQELQMSEKTLYWQQCAEKKQSWISFSSKIENPYKNNTPDCGKIAGETNAAYYQKEAAACCSAKK